MPNGTKASLRWEDLGDILGGMSAAQADLYKQQLRQQVKDMSPQTRQAVLSRLKGVPELSDIVGPSPITTAPKQEVSDVALWQKGLQAIGAPFQWVHEKAIEPFAAMVTAPWSPEVPGTAHLPALQRQLAEYKAWEAPWGVKGAVETLPWFAIPSGAGMMGRLGGIAARGGALARPAAIGAKVLRPVAAAERVITYPLAKPLELAAKRFVPKVPVEVGKVLDLPPSEELLSAVKTGVLSPKWLRIPGVRQLVGTVKFALTADDPVKAAKVVKGQMQDMAESGVFSALAKARAINPGIKIEDAIVVDPLVKQIKPLPGGKWSMAMHEVIEYAPRYKMPDKMPVNYRSFVDEIRSVSKAFTEMMEKEGLFEKFNIRRLKGETDFQYLHRVVLSVKEDYSRELANRVQSQLAKDGMPLVKSKDEAGWAYLTRVMDDVTAGKITPTPELDALIAEVGQLVDIVPRGIRLDKPRLHERIAEGLKAGVKYADDPLYELRLQGDAAYDLVIRKRIGDLFATELKTVTRGELVAEKIGVTPTELRAVVKEARTAKAAILNAIRGTVLLPQTINAIERQFPQIGVKLREASSIPIPKFEKAIKNISMEVWQAAKITRQRFRDMLDIVRADRRVKAGKVPLKEVPEEAIGKLIETEPTLAQIAVDFDKLPIQIKKSLEAVDIDRAAFGKYKPADLAEFIDTNFKQVSKTVGVKTPQFEYVGSMYVGKFKDLPSTHIKMVISAKPAISKFIQNSEIQKLVKFYKGAESFITKLGEPSEIQKLVKFYKGAESFITKQGKNILPGELSDTLARLGVESGTSVSLLQKIYRNAYRIPTKERKDLLSEALSMAKDEIIKSQRALDRAVRLGETVVTPEMGEVIGIPGISGRIIPTQVIGGKKVFGRDIATEIRKQFGWAPMGTAERLTSQVGFVGGLMRMAKASMDLSVAFIQLTPVLGIDFYNTLTSPLYAAGVRKLPIFGFVNKPSANWVKGISWSLRAAINPTKAEAIYWANPVNQLYLQEAAKLGALAQPSEYMEAFGSVMGKMVKAPPIAGKVLKQTYGRAEAAFTAPRNIVANEYRKGMWELASAEGKLGEMVRGSNLLTGVLSTRGMGISATQRNLESGLLFFSPRFTRAVGALLGHMLWNPKSWTGKEAMKAITGLLGANYMFFTTASLMLGQKPKIDPRPQSMGGDGAQWLTIKVGDRYIGLGGIMSDLRAAVNIISQGFTEPEELLAFDMSNPVLRRLRDKFAPPTAAVYDYLSGRDFIGRPVRGESLMPTKETIFEIGKWGLPIWVESMVEEGFSLSGAAGEFFGGRTLPESTWGLYKSRLVELSGKKTIRDISDYEKAQLEKKYPELVELKEVATKEMERRGYNPVASEYWNRRDDAISERISLLEEVQRQFDAGKITGSQVRRFIQDSGIALGASYKLLESDKRYADVIADMQERSTERTAEALEKGWGVDLAYRKYWDVMFDPLLYNALGEIDYNERDRRLTALHLEVGEAVWEKLQDWIKERNQRYPFIVRKYYAAQEVLKPYWDIETQVWAQHPPELKQLADQIIALESTNPRLAKQYLARYPQILYNRRLIAVYRKQMRLQNPDIAEVLRLFY